MEQLRKEAMSLKEHKVGNICRRVWGRKGKEEMT